MLNRLKKNLRKIPHHYKKRHFLFFKNEHFKSIVIYIIKKGWLLWHRLIYYSKNFFYLNFKFKKVDKNLLLKKKPKNILICTKNTKSKLFCHLLAQQIASIIAIDQVNNIKQLPCFYFDINVGKNIIIKAEKNPEKSKKILCRRRYLLK